MVTHWPSGQTLTQKSRLVKAWPEAKKDPSEFFSQAPGPSSFYPPTVPSSDATGIFTLSQTPEEIFFYVYCWGRLGSSSSS